MPHQLNKSRDAKAGDRLEAALKNQVMGEEVGPVAGAAYVQANLAQAGLYGLLRILKHKGVINETDLEGSLAWAYDERTARIKEASSIIAMPPAPTVNGAG
jgi:hypothetical protein